MPEGRLEELKRRFREGWEKILRSPGGPERVARGIGAGAFAAMMPAFGLHIALAAGLAFLLRGSMTAAGATCLLLGNPLTHALLIPAEYEIGRTVLRHEMHHHASPGASFSHWLSLGLPALEELLLGGVVIGIPVGGAAWLLSRQVLLRRAAAGRATGGARGDVA